TSFSRIETRSDSSRAVAAPRSSSSRMASRMVRVRSMLGHSNRGHRRTLEWQAQSDARSRTERRADLDLATQGARPPSQAFQTPTGHDARLVEADAIVGHADLQPASVELSRDRHQ